MIQSYLGKGAFGMGEAEIRVSDTGDFLHVRIVAPLSGTAAGHWARVWAACGDSDQNHILIEESLTGGQLGTLELFETASAWAQRRWPPGHRMAYVDVKGDLDDSSRLFAETVARNRGLNVRCFSQVAAATRWLRSPHDTPSAGVNGSDAGP